MLAAKNRFVPAYPEDIYPYATFQLRQHEEPPFQTLVYQDLRQHPQVTANGLCRPGEYTTQLRHGDPMGGVDVVSGAVRGVSPDECASEGSETETYRPASSRTESNSQLEDRNHHHSE